MKSVLFVLISTFILLLGDSVFAYCSTCRHVESNPYVGSCGYLSCRTRASCPANNDCECTDPYCNSADNTCMNCASCCDAFGNVGAR